MDNLLSNISNISDIKQFNLSDIYTLNNNSSNTKDDSSHLTFELYVVMVFFLFCCYYCCWKICSNKKLILDKLYESYVINDNSNNICSICLEQLNNNKEVVKLNNCSHIYHIKCIDPWLLENQTCPDCRQETRSLIK